MVTKKQLEEAFRINLDEALDKYDEAREKIGNLRDKVLGN